LIRPHHSIFWIVDRWIKKEIKIQLGSRQILQFFFINLHGPYFQKKKKKPGTYATSRSKYLQQKSKYPGRRKPGKLQMEASEIQQKRCAAMFSSSRELLDHFPSLWCVQEVRCDSLDCMSQSCVQQLLQGGRVSSEISRAFWL